MINYEASPQALSIGALLRLFTHAARLHLAAFVAILQLASTLPHPRWRVCTAMPTPKPDSGIWRPVQIKNELTVSGGKTTRSYVLPMDTLPLGDAEFKLVPISSADGWLCEMVTGQVSSRRPLGRSGLFKLVRTLVTPANDDDDPTTPDKMQDLAFDGTDDSLPTTEPSEKNTSDYGVLLISTKGPLSSGLTFPRTRVPCPRWRGPVAVPRWRRPGDS